MASQAMEQKTTTIKGKRNQKLEKSDTQKIDQEIRRAIAQVQKRHVKRKIEEEDSCICNAFSYLRFCGSRDLRYL
jgi:predicted transcriptional regulator